MNIETVKLQGESYLVNSSMSVPKSEGNRHYKLVQEWIAEGNVPEPEFTAEELATKVYNESLSIIKKERDDGLSALTHTFTDGSVAQVRPSDIPTFQLAISQGQSEDWVMADDTVRLLTVAEMTEAMNSGITQAKVIWNKYTEALKGI